MALLALGLVPALAALVWSGAGLVVVAWDALLVVLLAVDLVAAPRPGALEAGREVEDILSVGRPAPVALRLLWHGARPVRLSWVDAPPTDFAGEGHAGTAHLGPRSEHTAAYRVTPHLRGPHRFGELHLRLYGPLGLITRRHRVPLDREVRVYPDLEALTRDAGALLTSVQPGEHRSRRRGFEGREFDALRDYVQGDDYRALDWKATARRGRPVTRQYRPEQNQDVLLLVDCGRHMRPRIGARSKLDYAVETALSLAHLAIARGDQVGLVVFSHEVLRWLPPRKGRDQLLRMVEALYPVQPTLTESDYHAAYDALSRRALRRALVVTFTDVLDEDASAVLLQRTRLLRPRHLPLVCTIADSDLLEVAQAVPADRTAAYRRVAASRLVRDRQASLRHLTTSGALVVNAPAKELSAATLGRYLEVKSHGRL